MFAIIRGVGCWNAFIREFRKKVTFDGKLGMTM